MKCLFPHAEWNLENFRYLFKRCYQSFGEAKTQNAEDKNLLLKGSSLQDISANQRTIEPTVPGQPKECYYKVKDPDQPKDGPRNGPDPEKGCKQEEKDIKSKTGSAFLLSFLAMIFCPPMGIIAFVLAVQGHNSKKKGLLKVAEEKAKFSLFISGVGYLLGAIVLIILWILYPSIFPKIIHQIYT